MAQRKTTRKTSGKTHTSSRSTKKAGPSRKPKTSTRRRACSAAAKSVGDKEVAIDRRRAAGRRSEEASAEKLVVAGPKLERRQKVNRRRQIDPTTCERDYSDGEVEFMNALDEYKRKSGRMFPTCSEVLEVIRGLGYVKSGESTPYVGVFQTAALVNQKLSWTSVFSVLDSLYSPL